MEKQIDKDIDIFPHAKKKSDIQMVDYKHWPKE